MSICTNRHIANNVHLYKQICSMKAMSMIFIAGICTHENTCCKIMHIMQISYGWYSKVLFESRDCLYKNDKKLKYWAQVCAATGVNMTLHICTEQKIECNMSIPSKHQHLLHLHVPYWLCTMLHACYTFNTHHSTALDALCYHSESSYNGFVFIPTSQPANDTF